jgi:hypothetical protein
LVFQSSPFGAAFGEPAGEYVWQVSQNRLSCGYVTSLKSFALPPKP